MSVPGRCLSVGPGRQHLAIGPSVAETLLGMYQRGVFGYAIAVYLLIAGISQILSRRLNARHSLLFGCLAQVLAAVVFAAAIQWHSLGLAAAGWWWPAMLTAPFSLAARPGESDFAADQPCAFAFAVLRYRLYRQLGAYLAGRGGRSRRSASGDSFAVPEQQRSVPVAGMEDVPGGIPSLIIL